MIANGGRVIPFSKTRRARIGVCTLFACVAAVFVLDGCQAGQKNPAGAGSQSEPGNGPGSAIGTQSAAPVFNNWTVQGDSSRTGVFPVEPIRSAAVVDYSKWFSSGIASAPASDGSILFLPGDDGSLREIDTKQVGSGWIFDAGGTILGSPTLIDGKILFGTVLGTLYCVNESDGREVWRTRGAAPIAGSPGVASDRVYVGLGDGSVAAFGLEDGRQMWATSVDSGKPVLTPAVAEGTIFACASGGACVALSAADGHLLWSARPGGGAVTMPVVSGSTVFVGAFDNGLYALKIDDGSEVWHVGLQSPMVAASAVQGDRIFVASLDTYVRAYNARTGSPLWRFQAGAGFKAAPAIAGDVVMAGNADGYVYGLSVESGRLLWSVDLGEPVATGFSVGQHVATVGGGGDALYRITGSTASVPNPPETLVPGTGTWRYTVAPTPRRFSVPVSVTGLYTVILPDQAEVPMQITVRDPDGTDVATNLGTGGGESSLPGEVQVRLAAGKRYAVEVTPSGMAETHLLHTFHLSIRMLRNN
ncbi:MAG TPA: PQQ-binding-like beta-propeller repeat protein [Spirochaetia bacterium]|nr:PQQ-binding-like beta-propeller repeat protein [Spirochaetia bacterium]